VGITTQYTQFGSDQNTYIHCMWLVEKMTEKKLQHMHHMLRAVSIKYSKKFSNKIFVVDDELNSGWKLTVNCEIVSIAINQ